MHKQLLLHGQSDTVSGAMVKRFLQLGWSLRKQFAKYFVVGITTFVLDIGSLWVFTEFFHWMPTVAVIVNQVIILTLVFLLNKYWSFKAEGVTHRQMMRFFMLSVFNYIFAVGWMYVWNEQLGYNELIVRVANVILSVAWNFLLYKFWVYKPE